MQDKESYKDKKWSKTYAIIRGKWFGGGQYMYPLKGKNIQDIINQMEKIKTSWIKDKKRWLEAKANKRKIKKISLKETVSEPKE